MQILSGRVWTLEWLFSIIDRYNTQTILNFLMLIWRCWTIRNNLIAGEPISVSGSVAFLERYLESLFNIRQQAPVPDSKGKQKLFRDHAVKKLTEQPCAEAKWLPPDGEGLKINVDGAFIPGSGKGAIGIIIRNCRGQHLLSAWKELKHCTDVEMLKLGHASREFDWL